MLFEVKNLSFRYPGGPWILRDIDMEIEEGERVALLGPSGYGKSTLVQLLAGYLQPSEGDILYRGRPLPKKGFCPVQLIWQHPEQAVNPRWRMQRILREAWEPEQSFLDKIGIESEWMNRWPIELSGGELQRFCIARALSPKTEFLIADEMTTMLDVITQAQVWNFVLEEATSRGLGMIVVTHNPILAEKLCTRIVDLSSINRVNATPQQDL